MSQFSRIIENYMHMIDEANKYLNSYEMEYMKKDKKMDENENKFLLIKYEVMPHLYYAFLDIIYK